MKKILVFPVLFLMFGMIYYFGFNLESISKRKEHKYTQFFLDIPKVKEVKDFFFYEGNTWATIVLDEGGTIDFAGFNQESFVSTEEIIVEGMSDLSILCQTKTGDENSVSLVFNLVDYALFYGNLKIKSIQDVVQNYSSLYQLLVSNLPLKDSGEEYKISSGGQEVYCYKIRIE